MTIAAVVISLNEANNLPRCLNSLSWCEELLLIDSGSTDGSQAIAAQRRARVLEHRQPGRFSFTVQRNWALENGGLSSDWVLFLDADEEVGPACRRAIEAAIQSALRQEDGPVGFELTPRYWFLGRWLRYTQGYPNWHPRLVRRGHLSFEGSLWESFPADSRIGRIAEPYEHYAFSKGIDDWLERHRRYADWEAERIVAYLDGGGSNALGTRRWLRLRRLAAKLWPLRPLLRFSQKYLLQGGFREGWQGLLFSLLMAGYDLITVVKVIERKRLARGLPL
ncbi:glycosyltransferase family 2 protein [Vulcanococcus limneticus]|uniref:glycosyltransferase family 2 protein n=1 Tax=Vulcanococcus limneticus TaxID=2170428 RepID=UPI00350BBA47